MTGFLRLDFVTWSDSITSLLQECKKLCDQLVVGLPDNDMVLKLTDVWPACPYEGKEWYLQESGLVDRIVRLDMDTIKIEKCYEEISFDVFFYGTKYGRLYEEDYEFLSARKVQIVCCAPTWFSGLKTNGENGQIDSLSWKLSHSVMDQKIVLFGTGKYFQKYMELFGDRYKPAYAVDNDSRRWNTEISKIPVYGPDVLETENLDKVLIIICCRQYQDIIRQIEKLGKIEYRILHSCNYISVVEEYSVALYEEEIYLSKAHAMLMKLMKELDRVCTKYGLKYYVISGSLIGIVRHKGLIPWDDDIDVAMFREDYEKLKKIVAREWGNCEFVLADYDEIGENIFYDFMSRVVYCKEEIPTGLFRSCGERVNPKILNHMVLDIYVLDNSYGGWRHKVVTTLMSCIYVLCLGHRSMFDLNRYERLGGFKKIILNMAVNIGKRIPLRWLFDGYKMLRTYARGKSTKYCFESGGIVKYMPWLYDKALYGEGCRLSMHDLDVMVPSDYHGLLKAKNYGDYMHYPPIKIRKPSHTVLECKVIW